MLICQMAYTDVLSGKCSSSLAQTAADEGARLAPLTRTLMNDNRRTLPSAKTCLTVASSVTEEARVRPVQRVVRLRQYGPNPSTVTPPKIAVQVYMWTFIFCNLFLFMGTYPNVIRYLLESEICC